MYHSGGGGSGGSPISELLRQRRRGGMCVEKHFIPVFSGGFPWLIKQNACNTSFSTYMAKIYEEVCVFHHVFVYLFVCKVK